MEAPAQFDKGMAAYAAREHFGCAACALIRALFLQRWHCLRSQSSTARSRLPYRREELSRPGMMCPSRALAASERVSGRVL